jgi:phosphoribosylaminoimidazole-succinocarboxamide synthase
LANKKVLFESVGKKVYATDKDGQLIQEFTDETVGPGDSKKIKFKHRGEMAATIAIKIFEFLESYHIPTIYISQYGEREIIIRNNKSIPVEVIIRNYSDKEYGKHAGLKEGSKLEVPVSEFYSIGEDNEKRSVSESELVSTGTITAEEARMIKRIVMKLNALLLAYFKRRNLLLIDYKVQFGKYKGQVLLNTEIIPDSCSLNDAGDLDFKKLSLQERYLEAYNRLVG